jgi:hypothetical protein
MRQCQGDVIYEALLRHTKFEATYYLLNGHRQRDLCQTTVEFKLPIVIEDKVMLFAVEGDQKHLFLWII